ncbi:MAG: hypothetical protein WDN48_20845 [Pseudolabrys sp.]
MTSALSAPSTPPRSRPASSKRAEPPRRSMSVATSRAAALMMPLPRNGSTRTRGSRTVMRAMPTAAKAAISVARRRSPARRNGIAASQSPPAARTPSPGLIVLNTSARPPEIFTASNGATLSVSRRQRLAHLDALRHLGQKCRRVASGAQAGIGGNRPAVEQGQCRARPGRRPWHRPQACARRRRRDRWFAA